MAAVSEARACDWAAPWLQPLQALGQPAHAAWQAGAPLHRVLNGAGRAPVRFVPQAELPAGESYERHIFRSGCCPVRDNLHDFFNGLCWLHFPLTKARLNHLQSAQIEAHGVGAMRGPVRDAITVFDENAALLHAPDPLWDALAARQWRRLLSGELRPLWAQARLWLFGHALLEQLCQPYKGLTAHVMRVPGARPASAAALDACVAGHLSPEGLAAKPFVPLPVLGVPGWWPANEDPAFYDDARVFRAARHAAVPL